MAAWGWATAPAPPSCGRKRWVGALKLSPLYCRVPSQALVCEACTGPSLSVCLFAPPRPAQVFACCPAPLPPPRSLLRRSRR